MEHKIVEEFMDMIYPPRCPVCGEVKKEKNRLACSDCLEKLSWIQEPQCKKCGKMLATAEQEYCFDCGKMQYHFESGYPLWNYDDVMRKSIADFKYGGRREYGKFYGEAMVQRYGKKFLSLKIDAIIPVPIHHTKRKERGYNQTEIIADIVGKKLGIPVWKNQLVRIRKTMPQKELKQQERLKNLEEAFAIKEKYHLPEGTKVLLLDDIYTSGSTVEACTKVLLNAGIKKVYVTTLCIGKGY